MLDKERSNFIFLSLKFISSFNFSEEKMTTVGEEFQVGMTMSTLEKKIISRPGVSEFVYDDRRDELWFPVVSTESQCRHTVLVLRAKLSFSFYGDKSVRGNSIQLPNLNRIYVLPKPDPLLLLKAKKLKSSR
jgi:hypothetical protein